MYGFDLQECERIATANNVGVTATADEATCGTVADLLRPCRKIVFFTGAGISAESGVKTYRETDGVWQQYDVFELGSLPNFEKNAGAVWDMDRELKSRVRNSEPNQGHRAIADFEHRDRDREVTVMTQNIDGYHQIAGSDTVIELHGGLGDGAVCNECGEVR